MLAQDSNRICNFTIMTVQYLTDTKGKKTGVVLGIKDWERIQKKLNAESEHPVLKGIKQGLKEVEIIKKGKLKAKSLKDFLDEV